MDRDSGTFAKTLRQMRLAAALSQEELARCSELSLRGISDLERGVRRTPRVETVRRLADALGATTEERAALLAAARPTRRLGREATGPIRPYTRPPHPLTRLVGRQSELASLEALFTRDDVRLVTLTGTGGIGKTRLAFELALRLGPSFLDGVVFIDLAMVRDASDVAAALAGSLALGETDPRLLSIAVCDELARHQVLLLFDNFEHMLPAGALLTMCLQAAPAVKALVTSRSPLEVRGEHEFPVAPLALPNPKIVVSSTMALQSEAIELFVERVQQVRFGYKLTDADATAAVDIVTRLDGLPLAIELAAVRTRSLPVRELASALERRLPLLSTGARDAPARHSTMRDAIAWSYHLLLPAEQALFRRLAVFVGGFAPEAAVAVDRPGHDEDPWPRLTRLVDHGLVRVSHLADGRLRYSMLETIREYASEQLAVSGEATVTRERHLQIYLDLAVRAMPHLHGPQQAEWLTYLDDDHDNLRAALAWSIAHELVAEALRFGAHLWLFWLKRGHWTEGRRWLKRVLALCGTDSSAARAEVLLGAGNLAGVQGQIPDAEAFFEMSLTVWREVDSASGIARTLAMMGVAAARSSRFERAVSLLREAMPLFDLPQDEPWAALATSYLGLALVSLDELDSGLLLAEEGLARQLAVDEQWAVANGFVLLGDALLRKGENRRAAALFANGLQLWSAQQGGGIVLWPLLGLARVANILGQARDVALLIGFYDAITAQADAGVEPILQEIYQDESEAALAALSEDEFVTIRDRGRRTPAMRVPPETLRIAMQLSEAP